VPTVATAPGTRGLLSFLAGDEVEGDAFLVPMREGDLEIVTPAFIERDISTDPAWERTYHASIPVVELGDRRLETVTSVAKLRRLLDEVLDGAIVPTP